MERQQRYAEESEEEEEYDGDFLRRTPSLDDKAKLITVEEVCLHLFFFHSIL